MRRIYRAESLRQHRRASFGKTGMVPSLNRTRADGNRIVGGAMIGDPAPERLAAERHSGGFHGIEVPRPPPALINDATILSIHMSGAA
jgi:hypothetical protein